MDLKFSQYSKKHMVFASAFGMHQTVVVFPGLKEDFCSDRIDMLGEAANLSFLPGLLLMRNAPLEVDIIDF